MKREFDQFVDLSQYDTQPISRRDVLKTGGKIALSLTGAGVIFNKILPNVTPDSLDVTHYYELLRGQDLRFYAHDAAENLRTIERAFGLGAEIEANILSADGKLYVAHDRGRFNRMSQAEKQDYRAERVIDLIIEADENPALDIKFSESDTIGVSQLKELVGRIPDDRFTTISGIHHGLLDQFETSENRLVSYTVKDSRTLQSMINRAHVWKENDIDLTGVGVALSLDMAYRGKVEYFKENYGISSCVWVVDNVEDMVTFQQEGAFAITTERYNVIRRVNHDSTGY